MTAQAAPAAGVEGRSAEQTGNNAEERGHGLPAAGGIQGKQVGPGGTDRTLAADQRRQEIHIRGNDRRRHGQLRIIIRHQGHPGSVRAGNRPARCVKNRGK